MPRPLARFLIKHEVVTSVEMGWSRLKNGDLLAAAESNGFDVMVTADQNLVYQQNLKDRKIALLVLPSGRWPRVQPFIPQIIEALDVATTGSYQSLAPAKLRKREPPV